jgi:hypothetical protein
MGATDMIVLIASVMLIVGAYKAMMMAQEHIPGVNEPGPRRRP